MNTIFADECFQYLIEAHQYLKEIVPIDPYYEIFEAETEEMETQLEKNKINVAKHRAKCEVAKFMNTNKVMTSIRNAINKILGKGGEVDPDIKNMKPRLESTTDEVSIDNTSEYIDSLIESVETEFNSDIGFVDNVVNILENSI